MANTDGKNNALPLNNKMNCQVSLVANEAVTIKREAASSISNKSENIQTEKKTFKWRQKLSCFSQNKSEKKIEEKRIPKKEETNLNRDSNDRHSLLRGEVILLALMIPNDGCQKRGSSQRPPKIFCVECGLLAT